MNGKSSSGEMSFIQFHFINVKGHWVYLAEKNTRPGAKIITIFRLS